MGVFFLESFAGKEKEERESEGEAERRGFLELGFYASELCGSGWNIGSGLKVARPSVDFGSLVCRPNYQALGLVK